MLNIVGELFSHYQICHLRFLILAGRNHRHTTKEKYFRKLHHVSCFHINKPIDICSYQPQQLYNVVADVASYPRFIPFCTGSRIIDKVRHGDSSTSPISMNAELTVGFLSLKESYVSKVTCRPFLSVEVSVILSGH